MPPTKLAWTDEQAEQIIGNLLRIGVSLAAAVVFLGGLVYLLRHGAAPPQYQVFRGEPADLRTISGIVSDALSVRGRGLIQLGLLLLIATPVARVAFSVFAFARQHDLAGTVGSDAHAAFELGRSVLLLDQFADAEGLRRVVRQDSSQTLWSPPWFHLISRYAQFRKRINKRLDTSARP